MKHEAGKITERLPLADCRPGDDIDIRYSHNGSWKSIGRGMLLKIKELPRGGHQIKFRSSWRGSTVQKHDVPAGVVVERHREPTPAEIEAEPSLAPRPEPRRAVVDGITYAATDPTVDLEDALQSALARSGAMPASLDERHLAIGLKAMDMAAASLGMAALLSGAGLRRID